MKSFANSMPLALPLPFAPLRAEPRNSASVIGRLSKTWAWAVNITAALSKTKQSKQKEFCHGLAPGAGTYLGMGRNPGKNT